MKNQHDYVRITFRCPPELHKELKSLSDISETSLNTEIIRRLELSRLLDENIDEEATNKKILITSQKISDLVQNLIRICKNS